MTAIHLANAVGGDLLTGFMSAVTFATILAVVAGLTVSGGAAISHDFYAQILCKGKPDEKKELFLTRQKGGLKCHSITGSADPCIHV